MKYECYGSVRGTCGTVHRSYAAARRHCAADMAGCEGQGGYSDRAPRPLDDEARADEASAIADWDAAEDMRGWRCWR